MPPLDDLRDFLEQPTLILPIGGKEYVVEACSAKTWLQLQAFRDQMAAFEKDPKKNKPPTIKDVDFYRLNFGDAVYEQMIEDGVRPAELQFASVTANLWQLGDAEIAEAYWRSGGKAQAQKGNPADPPKTATPTHTGEATTTRKRASRSTTTTRQKNRPDEQG